jgi:hypothetical protein
MAAPASDYIPRNYKCTIQLLAHLCSHVLVDGLKLAYRALSISINLARDQGVRLSGTMHEYIIEPSIKRPSKLYYKTPMNPFIKENKHLAATSYLQEQPYSPCRTFPISPKANRKGDIQAGVRRRRVRNVCLA